jgi:hypothetical protein
MGFQTYIKKRGFEICSTSVLLKQPEADSYTPITKPETSGIESYRLNEAS